ncbi:hypothetical protein IT575_06175 [bacterium]|nr:hypothetical protein [bacterium]
MLSLELRGARHLRAVYASVDYDPDLLTPLDASFGPGLGSPEERLELLQFDTGRPGELHLGQTLLGTALSDCPFSGDTALLTIRFAATPSPQQRSLKAASSVPGSDRSASLALWNSAAQTLEWDYALQGDYNQDGRVAVSDLTQIGIHFRKAAPTNLAGRANMLSIVDGDGNGQITVADLTPIGLNYGQMVSSYRVYGADSVDDKPGNTQTSSLSPLGEVAFGAALGNALQERLRFQYQLSGAVPAYLWVRPSDGSGEGTPSKYADEFVETPLEGLTLSASSYYGIISGSGSETDPYLNTDLWYAAHFNDDVAVRVMDGELDVTADPALVWSISPDVATVSSPTWARIALRPDVKNWGKFMLSAQLNGKGGSIWFDITRGVQLSLTGALGGSGTQADPYLVGIDSSLPLSVYDVREGEVAGGTDTWEGGWTHYSYQGTWTGPEDEGTRTVIFTTHDTVSNTAFAGFEDSAGGDTTELSLYAERDMYYDDGAGLYAREAGSNTIYFDLLPGGLLPSDGYTAYPELTLPGDVKATGFHQTTWFNALEGYGVVKDSSNWDCYADLFHTTDGGASWNYVSRIQGGNGINYNALYISIWPDQMWYTSYGAGFGIQGTAGVSYDGGLTWNARETSIQTALDPDPAPGFYSYPLRGVVRGGGMLFVAGGEGTPWLAYCSDDPALGGTDWLGFHSLADGNLELLPGNGTVFARGSIAGATVYFRWSGSAFIATAQPDQLIYPQSNQWWRCEPGLNYLMIGRSQLDPLYNLCLSPDGSVLYEMYYVGGATPADSVFRSSSMLRLNDGTAYMIGYKPEGNMEGGAKGHTQLLSSSDGGATWQLLMSQFAAWWGVGSYTLEMHMTLDGQAYLTRNSSGIEYSRKLFYQPVIF